MPNPFIRKLEKFTPLSAEDRSFLDEIVEVSHTIEADSDIIHEGDATENVHLITAGFACRYKLLEDGSRQIVGYLVPGDFCDLHVFILRQMDHSIASLSRCTVSEISRSRILELTTRPTIARALWWVTLVDEAVLREWLLNMGQRPADQRIAHLLCEMLLRLRAAGLADGDSYALPITQVELADTLGLSPVHMNRSLQKLRATGFVTFKNNEIEIIDFRKLAESCGFTSNYLHLDKLQTRPASDPEVSRH